MLLITAKAQGLIAEFDGFTLWGEAFGYKRCKPSKLWWSLETFAKQDSCDDKCSLVGEVLLVSYREGL